MSVLSERAHYACGHEVDFLHGPGPDAGDWMICVVCGAETTVLRMEHNLSVERHEVSTRHRVDGDFIFCDYPDTRKAT